MNVLALDIYVGPQRAGLLFQYGTGSTALTRFIPDEAFWSNTASPVLSWAAMDDDPQRREIFWRSYVSTPFFNAEDGRLPAFFQNLLPEGPLRRHLEELRGCGPNDHFDLLAACGTSTTDRALSGAGIGAGLGAAGSMATGGSPVTGGLLGGAAGAAAGGLTSPDTVNLGKPVWK